MSWYKGQKGNLVQKVMGELETRTLVAGYMSSGVKLVQKVRVARLFLAVIIESTRMCFEIINWPERTSALG